MGELLNGVSRVGPYRVDGLLGRGGMATVYLGFHEGLERRVAIKVMPAAVSGGEALKRLHQEAVTVAKLRHPHILNVYDFGIQQGLAYLVTDLVDGGSLEQRLVAPLGVPQVVEILEPIASALDHAHHEGVLHRDVKPGNILLRQDGTPVLADFGLVKVLDANQTPAESNLVLGTPAYMAPEQGTGTELTPAADVYSLAVTAYRALAGRLPFDAPTALALVLAHMRDPVPPIREFRPEISDQVDRALLRGLAKMPEDRPPSASELVESLRLAERRRSRPRLSRPTRVVRTICRVAGSLAAAAVLLAVAAGAAQPVAARDVVVISAPDVTSDQAAHRALP